MLPCFVAVSQLPQPTPEVAAFQQGEGIPTAVFLHTPVGSVCSEREMQGLGVSWLCLLLPFSVLAQLNHEGARIFSMPTDQPGVWQRQGPPGLV